MPQFEELMEALDNRYFEADLCQTIEFEKAEIERQMELTEKLTNDLKPSLSKKSYLELENQTIVKAQEVIFNFTKLSFREIKKYIYYFVKFKKIY